MKYFVVFAIIAQVAVYQTVGQIIRAVPNGLGSIVGFPSPCSSPCSNIYPNILAANMLNPNLLAGDVFAPNVLNSNMLAPNVLNSNILSGPNMISSPVIAPAPSVANNLADTLSLLTVSSLLSESLPLGLPNVVGVQAPLVGGCGCGYGGYGSILL